MTVRYIVLIECCVIDTMSSSGEKTSLMTLLRMKTILLLSILISNLGGSPGVLFLYVRMNVCVCMNVHYKCYDCFSNNNLFYFLLSKT